jgi:hypothetical protein
MIYTTCMSSFQTFGAAHFYLVFKPSFSFRHLIQSMQGGKPGISLTGNSKENKNLIN